MKKSSNKSSIPQDFLFLFFKKQKHKCIEKSLESYTMKCYGLLHMGDGIIHDYDFLHNVYMEFLSFLQ